MLRFGKISIFFCSTIPPCCVLCNMLKRKCEIPLQSLCNPYCFHHYTVQGGNTVFRTVCDFSGSLGIRNSHQGRSQRLMPVLKSVWLNCWPWSLGHLKKCNFTWFLSHENVPPCCRSVQWPASWEYAECHVMNQLQFVNVSQWVSLHLLHFKLYFCK